MEASDRFVGRQHELEQLEAYLRQALEDEGQVCFVTGEAGSGKTALVHAFTDQAQQKHPELVTAFGQCDAQTGIGDAYLPFREVLHLLTGDVNDEVAQGTMTRENARRLQGLVAHSADALLELGPDLLGLFIPGASLAASVAAFAADKSGLMARLKQRLGPKDAPKTPQLKDIDQSQIFEQYVNVLRALASERPLLVVLDDLQWADASSIELMFHLTRRIGNAPMLLLGTYRADEVALGRGGERHPLDKVVTEIKRYRGDIWIDLDETHTSEGRELVDALIDREPNDLGEPYRARLYEHVGGNALFTVELLREMKNRGYIVRDEAGRWIEGPALDWTVLPARIEGVIHERVQRLREEARENLTVGSIEGSEFTAEVVAQVQQVAPRDLVRQFSGELDRKQRLITSIGTKRLGRQRFSRYAFAHDLFQRYLYEGLDEIERVYLHEDVGYALEDLWGDRADKIAIQLSRHFVEADVRDKARQYLRKSGEQAAARYAHEEAEDYLTHALQLTGGDELEERYAILLTREHVFHMRGEREAQRQDLDALQTLASELKDDGRRTAVALRAARYAETVSDYPQAIKHAQAAIELAKAGGEGADAVTGHLQAGRAAWHIGDFDTSRSQLDRALALARRLTLRALEADCLNNLGIVSWYQGDFELARGYFQEALPIKQQTEDKLGEGHVLMNLASISCEQGRYDEAIADLHKTLDLYHATGYRRGEAIALCNLSGFLLYQGEYAEARDCLEQCLPLYLEIGDQEGVTASHINLGIIAVSVGDHDEAEHHLQKALTLSQSIGDWRGELEAVIYLGLLSHYRGDDETAREESERAVALARQADDTRNCAHALTHLGHALTGLGHLRPAVEAYAEAVQMREASGEPHRAVESLAGLAQVSLEQGQPAEALSHVEGILAFLQSNTLDGTDDPLRIYLSCYRVLQAHADGRAQDVLGAAEALLEERLAKIDRPEWRRSFIENVPSHRELVEVLSANI